ncbi:hypothetical protein ALC53_07580 [Atta colombica]|uniref:Uncharacterized protein n=1 Tax=Atta colombica TaxID=520822 RepID=A0A195BCL7_9HYME|nr:hypothetical protein ALC53_07580 [Atta colombica]
MLMHFVGIRDRDERVLAGNARHSAGEEGIEQLLQGEMSLHTAARQEHMCNRKKVNGSKRFRGDWHEDRSRISFDDARIKRKDILIPVGDVLINGCGILYVVTQTIGVESLLEKAVSVLSKVLRMSFSPIENRCRSIIKALAFLATFIRYHEMENEGDKNGRRMAGKGSASVILPLENKVN